MKKLTILLSVLMVALTSVFAEQQYVRIDPSEKDFGTVSIYPGDVAKDSFDFEMDTLIWPAVLKDPVVKGGPNGKVSDAKYVTVIDEEDGTSYLYLRVTYTANKKGNFEDSIFVAAGALKDTVVVKLTVEEKAIPVIDVASSYSFGSVEFADAKNGITNDIAATVSEGTISAAVEGDDAAAFTTTVADGKLYIKFQPAKPEVRAYAAKVVLSAPHAESKEVTLSASVKMPKPELSVLPTSWTEKTMLINGVAKAEKVFSISGLYLFSLPQASIQGGESSPFKWDAATSKVTFSANAAKLYQDTLVITADNADPIKVGLEVDVKRPVIVLDDDELDFGTISLADALSGNVSPKTTNVSISTGVKLNVAVSPATAPFSAKIEDGKLIVSFKSQTVGSFTAKAVISAADAEDAEVELSASVTMPTPELKVLPVEWKDTVEMVNSCAKAERQISIIPVYIFTAPSVTIQGGAKSPFAWDAANSKVTFEACYREATYQDTLIVSALGVADVKVPLEVTVVHPSETKIAVTGVTLDPASAEMEIGDIIALNAVVAPANATDKSLVWESSNAAVATVDNGLVTAIAKGKATIIVRTVDGNFAATCAITVKEAETPVVPVAVTGVTLDKKTASIEKGQTLTLTATVAPANADNKAVTWASSNTAVATVANGVVTAVAVGTATITVKTVDGGFTATCAVTVTDGGVTPPPAGATDVITYVETGLKDLAQSGYKEAAITNMPSGAEYLILGNCGVEYIQMRTSDNKSGFVTTKSAGTVQSVEIKFNEKTTDRTVNIYGSNTAYTSTEALYAADATLLGAIGAADDNKKLTISGEYQYIGIRSNSGAVYIDEIDITWGGGTTPVTPVAVTGVTLDKTTASIEKGSKLTLKATIAPADATNKAVTWESSNTAVATVANGVVTAVAVGTATITVKTADGGFTATCAVTVTEGSTPPTPSGKVDQITYANSGMKGDAKSYADITISGMPSGATYILNAYDGASGVSFIQIRSNNNNSGLVTTKSEGSVLSVEIKFNAKTTDRKVNIYGSNTAFTSPTELYADGLTQLGTIGAGDANKKLTITGDYKYIGIRSADGTVYIDEIDIEYGNFEEKATTTLKFKTATAEVEVGKTVALEVERDGNDALTWKTSDASIATVANGVVTGIKEGTVKITATANNISDECTVTVKKAASPDEVPVKSIAEFIAAKGGKCKLIGIVSDIKKYDDGTYNKFGNFNLTDNSGTIYVYGLLTAAGEKQQFQNLGVDEGDTLTVIAENYQLYKETDEVVDAIFVEVHKGSGGTPTPSGEKLDVNYVEAAYLEDEEGPFWEVFAAKIDDDYNMNYPLLIMDIDNTNATHLSGEYDVFYAILYTSDNDSIEFADSKVVVRCVELAADELSGPVYHFVATLRDEAGKEYVYEFESEVYAYDGMNSTEEDIIWIDLEDPVQGIDEIEVTIDMETPIYNIMGQRVGRNTPGILIQNGRKFLINGL